MVGLFAALGFGLCSRFGQDRPHSVLPSLLGSGCVKLAYPHKHVTLLKRLRGLASLQGVGLWEVLGLGLWLRCCCCLFGHAAAMLSVFTAFSTPRALSIQIVPTYFGV